MTKSLKTFETKFETLGEGKILGRASVYDVVDSGGDIVRRGAFAADFAKRGNVRPILADHDPTRSIGLGTFTEKVDGLHVAIDLAMELPDARDAFVRVQKGISTGLSIGYSTLREDFSRAGRELRELSLWETSIVVFPMNVHAQITAAKGNPQQLEELLSVLRTAKIAARNEKERADAEQLRAWIKSARSRVRA